ncbi:hypothetical protein Btru_031479 [Bulinus truncatus]|nr:hypothetical protein Btru_031479 [Bulinus truncatus]
MISAEHNGSPKSSSIDLHGSISIKNTTSNMADQHDVSEVCFASPPVKRRRRSSSDKERQHETPESLGTRFGRVYREGHRLRRERSDFSQTVNEKHFAQCALGDFHAGSALEVWELVPAGGLNEPADLNDKAVDENATSSVEGTKHFPRPACAIILGAFSRGKEEEARLRLEETLSAAFLCRTGTTGGHRGQVLARGVDRKEVPQLPLSTKERSLNCWIVCIVNHPCTHASSVGINSIGPCAWDKVKQRLVKSAYTCHDYYSHCCPVKESGKAFELSRDINMSCIPSEGGVLECSVYLLNCKGSSLNDARDSRAALTVDTCDVRTHRDVQISTEIADQLNIDSGANMAPCSHDTPVQLAAKLGSFRLLQDLLGQGVGADSVTEGNKLTALMEAARSGRIDMVELLVQHKADVNLCLDDKNNDFKGYTALDMAIAHGGTECAEFLLSCHARIDFDEAVIISVLHQSLKSLTWLCRHYHRKDVDEKIISLGLLHAAARDGHGGLLPMLIEFGIDVNSVYRQQTPLMAAGSCDVVDCLIRHDADVNAVVATSDGQMTALLNAVSPRYISALENRCGAANVFGELERIVRKLVQHGASLTAVDAAGNTPLMAACGVRGAESTLQFLSGMSNDASIQMNCGGESVLHLAVRSNALKNVKAIAGWEVGQVNLPNSLGTTPLMIAAINRNMDIMEYLIKQGASVNARDHGGNTSLIHAVKSYWCEAEHIKMLLQAGADPNVENEMGYCALTTAVANLSKEALFILLEPHFKMAEDRKQKALCLLLAGNVFTHKAIECATLLLDRGTCSSNINPSVIHRFIADGHTDIVLKLIHNGTPPTDVRRDDHMLTGHCWPGVMVSPVRAALMTNQYSLARCLADLWFYTKSDSQLMNDVRLKEHLRKNKYTECEHLLQELSSHTMSLKVLAFTTISDSVGHQCNRANKIAQLRVPEMVKKVFMFKEYSQ